MTLEDLLKYCTDRFASVRVDCGEPGVINVQLHNSHRSGIADAATFEDAFELAKMKFESGWKVGR